MKQRHPERESWTDRGAHAWHGRLRWVALLGFAWVLGLGTLLSSCEQPVRAGAPSSGRPTSPGLSSPFDVGAVIRQVHFAWRSEEGGFSAGHSTYAARSSAEGEWTFTPYHQLPELGMLQGAPLRIETSALSRGGRPLSSLGRAEISDDGSLSIARGAAVEHLRNGEEGVHPSWTFARRPGGTGSLTVRVRVEGMPFVGETTSGLHFAGPNGLGVRYGAAAWTGTSGARIPVRTRYVAGQVVIEVPAEVVESAAFPAVLSLTVSPEFGMDNPVPGPVARIQSTPDVGFDGQNFLVVWQDSRGSSTSDVYDIFGARVSPSGVVLDPSGIVISNAVEDQRAPSVGFDGQRYLVVWQDSRSGSPRIHASRVTAAGSVLEPDGIPLSNATGAQTWPVLAFDGQNYLVAWQDFRNTSSSSDIYGTRVSPSGTVLDPDGIVISSQPFSQAVPDIAFDGQNYFLVWQDQRAGGGGHIFGGRVSPSGAVLDGPGFAVSTPISVELEPAVAFDGTNYLVVWQDDRGGAYDIYGVRVQEDGTVLDPSGIALSTATNNQSSPMAVHDGQGYFVAWQDQRTGNADIYGARVNSAGQVLDPAGIAISARAGSQNRPAVATSGQSHLVVWYDDRANFSPDIYGARVGADGTVLDPTGFVINSAANSQLVPAVAFDGQHYLVAWHDFRNGGTADIYGARVTTGGSVLDSTATASPSP